MGEGIPRERFEFQMLYGIRRDLQARFAGQGYPVRVYVPYGTEWYPYLMRRLAERSARRRRGTCSAERTVMMAALWAAV